MRPTQRSRNRLVQRLHSHANMTALFRFSDGAMEAGTSSRARSMASVANDAGSYTIASLPLLERPVQTHPAAGAPAYTSHKPSFERSQPVKAQTDLAAPVPSSSVQRVPETDQSGQPTATKDSRSTDDDRIWNRLQNIFTRHKQKGIPQESASVPQPGEPAALMQDKPPVTDNEQLRVSSMHEPAANAEPATPSVQMTRETTDVSSSQIVLPAAPQRETKPSVVQTQREPGHVDTANVTDASAAAEEPGAVNSERSITTPPATQAARAVTHALDADRSGEAEIHNEVRDLGHGALSQELPGRAATESSDPGAPELQALPLEAVWAVQTTRHPQSKSSVLPNERTKPVLSGEEIESSGESAQVVALSREDAESHDVVKSVLQGVHTSESTNSEIEFIPPLRPRPARSQREPGTLAEENIAPLTEQPHSSVQRQVDVDLREEIGGSGLVATEIGPLPKDLWNLVGARPPVGKEESSPAVSGSIAAAVPEAQRSHLGEAHSTTPLNVTSQRPLVQRQSASPPTSEQADAPATPEGARDEEQAGEEMDIEELARKVYSELRYRLELEWERLRRR